MKPYVMLLCMLVTLGCYISASAFTKKKELEKTYPVSATTKVVIENKYGNIIINSWNNLEIKILATITTSASDDISAQNILNKIEVKFSELNNTIYITSMFKKNFSVSKLYANLFKQGDLSINFIIYSPSNLLYDIQLEKGDLRIKQEIRNLRLIHKDGILDINKLSGKDNILKLSYVKSFFKSIDKAKLNLRWSKFNSFKNGDLKITSTSSTLAITSVDTIRIKSVNDKIQMDGCNYIFGNLKLTNLLVTQLNNTTILESLLGKIDFEKLVSNFNSLHLKLHKTRLRIHLENPNCVNLLIHHNKQAKLHIPKYFNMQMKFGKNKRNFISENNTPLQDCKHFGKVLVEIKGGNLSINK